MMAQQSLSDEQALQYVGELVAEYMKTLPPPVRGPVLEAANACLGKLGKAIDPGSTKKEVKKGEK